MLLLPAPKGTGFPQLKLIMKKKKGLLMSCLLLILLVGIYVGVLRINSQKEVSSNQESEEQTVSLLSMNREDIVKLSYTRADGTYTFHLVDDFWVSEEEPQETLSQSYLVNIRNLFSGTDAEGIVDTVTQNLQNYGLDIPQYMVTATTSSGEEQTLYIGNFNSSVDQYYVYCSTVEGIYLIPKRVVTYFSYDLNEMISVETLPSFSTEIVFKFEQIWNEETISIEKKESENYDASDMITWFLTTGFEHEIGCSTSELETLFSNLSNLTYRKMVKTSVTQENLVEYGLLEPKGSIYIEYTDSESASQNSFQLLIGNMADDNNYYVKEGTKDKVFTMSKESLDKILNHKKYDYVYRYPSTVDVRTVENVCVQNDGVSYDLGVRMETATTESESTIENVVYSYKEKELSKEQQDTASTLYSDLISFYAEQIIDQPEELGEQIDFSITFERKNELKKVEVLFYKYNSSYVLCSVNGDAIYLVSLRELEGFRRFVVEWYSLFE